MVHGQEPYPLEPLDSTSKLTNGSSNSVAPPSPSQLASTTPPNANVINNNHLDDPSNPSSASAPPKKKKKSMAAGGEPAFRGYVESTLDALLIFEACKRGVCPKIVRRLQESEKKQIGSGSVYVFDETEAGIRRWTDGLVWSPSRILQNFLVYRELDKKSQNPMEDAGKRRGLEPNEEDGKGSIDKNRERALVGSLTSSYRFKKDGLIKKTISLSGMHLISYYKLDDVINGRLRTPSTQPELNVLELSPNLLSGQSFRVPPQIEVGPDGQPRYRGESREGRDSVPGLLQAHGFGGDEEDLTKPRKTRKKKTKEEEENGGGGGINESGSRGDSSPGASEGGNSRSRGHTAELGPTKPGFGGHMNGRGSSRFDPYQRPTPISPSFPYSSGPSRNGDPSLPPPPPSNQWPPLPASSAYSTPPPNHYGSSAPPPPYHNQHPAPSEYMYGSQYYRTPYGGPPPGHPGHPPPPPPHQPPHQPPPPPSHVQSPYSSTSYRPYPPPHPSQGQGSTPYPYPPDARSYGPPPGQGGYGGEHGGGGGGGGTTGMVGGGGVEGGQWTGGGGGGGYGGEGGGPGWQNGGGYRK